MARIVFDRVSKRYGAVPALEYLGHGHQRGRAGDGVDGRQHRGDQHQGQRARPELLDQVFRGLVEVIDQRGSGPHRADQHRRGHVPAPRTAGAELAIASDFLLMAESAQIGLPEISLGTFLGGGVTALLPRLVGLAKARELVFLGERIKGAQAVRIGLAHRSFPDAGFLDAAREFARRVAGKAPIAMQLAKEQLNFAAERTLDAVLAAELEGMTFVATTRDWQEGVDAFAEKRTPVFKGE